ncbi:4Fe-4S dicluster domain-containing protein [Methanobrevibacter sp.]|uniref:4Fe-4S dicluster domain-containing protein n=1 Tax=Methanobrevibacter sp. TaxID=66852 RepID=UPI0026DFE121|nr:4Fe-4S dicluster domain-containing protein [Methanobrevibacter sp.]MDO5823398.1 hypothetical protein [Methanobrevibacter sp.]
MRHRHGNSSLGLEIVKLFFSEFLSTSYKPKWRISNNIERCTLCGRCESVCCSQAISVSTDNRTWTLNNRRCNKCLKCVMSCPARCLAQVDL